MNMRGRKFEVDRANGKIAGVCAGFANMTGIDVTIVRVALVLLTLTIAFPWSLIAYAVAAFAGAEATRLRPLQPVPAGFAPGAERTGPQPRPQDAGDRDLRHQLEQQARPRDRGAALNL